jgi:parallel beta-helix repeat protein
LRPLVLLLLFLASSADAATYVVAKNGRDTNPGTAARPFLTIARAISRVRAGDTVLVRTGVYREPVLIWDLKGTPDAAIRVVADRGANPVIDGQGLKVAPGLVTIGSSEWVHFGGFEVRNSTADGISLRGVKNVVIRENVVHHSQFGGIRAWNGNMDLTVDHNTVHHNVLSNSSRRAKQWSQAIGIEDTVRATVTGNRVYQNYGEGIDLIRTTGGTVSRNRVADNFSVNVYLDNARSITVDANLIRTTDEAFYRNNIPASAITMANERYRRQNPIGDIAITNNIIVRAQTGVSYNDAETGGGLHGVRVANNTLYGLTSAAFVFGSRSRHSSTVVEKNIVYQRRNGAYTARATNDITWRGNAWFGGNPSTRQNGPGDVNRDPLFVKPGGGDPADYELRDDSPLRGKGIGAQKF